MVMDDETWDKVRGERMISPECPGRGTAKILLGLETSSGRPSIDELEDVDEAVEDTLGAVYRFNTRTGVGQTYAISYILLVQRHFTPTFQSLEDRLLRDTYMEDVDVSIGAVCVGDRDLKRGEYIGPDRSNLESLSGLVEEVEEAMDE